LAKIGKVYWLRENKKGGTA